MALLHEARNTTPSHRIPAENLTRWRSWDLNAGLNEKNIYQNLILFWCANWKIAKFEYEIFYYYFWFFDFLIFVFYIDTMLKNYNIQKLTVHFFHNLINCEIY